MNAGSAAIASPVKAQLRDLAVAGRAIEPWLRARIDPQIIVRRVSTPASAGVANETLIVETDGPRYIVRVDASDHLFMGMDLTLHYRMYRALADEPGIPVPRVFGFEDDRSILGERFFVMEAIAGDVPPDRPNFNEAGWLKERGAAEREAIWRDTVATMARFHAIDPARFGFLDRPALGASGLAQDFAYWLSYADACAAERHALLAYARDWLARGFPDPAPTGLSWGDARLQNVMVRDGRVAALLDWDMVSLAGPEADLAWWALADHKYTASKGRARLPGIGSPAATIALWEELSGRRVRALDWHLVFASYRQALISIRLPQLTRRLRKLPPDTEGSIPASPGLQWLACLLDQPLGEPITLPFVGLDK